MNSRGGEVFCLGGGTTFGEKNKKICEIEAPFFSKHFFFEGIFQIGIAKKPHQDPRMILGSWVLFPQFPFLPYFVKKPRDVDLRVVLEARLHTDFF